MYNLYNYIIVFVLILFYVGTTMAGKSTDLLRKKITVGVGKLEIGIHKSVQAELNRIKEEYESIFSWDIEKKFITDNNREIIQKKLKKKLFRLPNVMNKNGSEQFRLYK